MSGDIQTATILPDINLLFLFILYIYFPSAVMRDKQPD